MIQPSRYTCFFLGKHDCMRLNGQLFWHHFLPKYMYAIFCRDVSLNLEMYSVKLRNKKIKRKNVSF